MAERDWNDSYAAGALPWDTGVPDEQLVAFVRAGRVAPGPTLEVGAGTGTNALWLAQQGFDVLGIDLAPLAVERARAKAKAAQAAASAVRCRFEAHDFLADPPAGSFAFVFDRGCFHVFDEPEERARFAARVAERLAPGGVWLSLIGSTEGPPRDYGPPRRSARDVIDAVEPALAIDELAAVSFGAMGPAAITATAWRCVARRRDVPAQPSSRHP
ncbi:MAG TPA: class I SAM-dependent methyltransferase [Kofleriaceae bacterium]|nr:class I SAM-dependent methyltransferase [Kofleriaceae bacterium]